MNTTATTAHRQRDPDKRVRDAAFKAIEKLSLACGGMVPWRKIADGFHVDGQKVLFATQARGIFKPKQMATALSIKTTVSKSSLTQYHDQDPNIASGGSTGTLRYDLAHGGQNNRFLRKAWKLRAPLIYFRGSAPAMYEPIQVWISKFNEAGGYVVLLRAKPPA